MVVVFPMELCKVAMAPWQLVEWVGFGEVETPLCWYKWVLGISFQVIFQFSSQNKILQVPSSLQNWVIVLGVIPVPGEVEHETWSRIFH